MGKYEVVKSLSGVKTSFLTLSEAVKEQQRLLTKENIKANVYYLRNVCSAPKWVA